MLGYFRRRLLTWRSKLLHFSLSSIIRERILLTNFDYRFSNVQDINTLSRKDGSLGRCLLQRRLHVPVRLKDRIRLEPSFVGRMLLCTLDVLYRVEGLELRPTRLAYL